MFFNLKKYRNKKIKKYEKHKNTKIQKVTSSRTQFF